MDIDHEAPRLLQRRVLTWGRRLAVAEAEEGEVVPGVGLESLGADGHRDVHVHHLHGAALPVEDGLHGAALRHALRAQGHHHVHGEPLAGLDLAHDLERQLLGDEVQGLKTVI